MPEAELKKGDLVIASRIPGFEADLRSSSLRVTSEGRGSYASSRFVGSEGARAVERREHVFPASALRRIRGLLEGLPPQGRPNIIMDDSASRVLCFWSGEEARVLQFYEEFFDDRMRHHLEKTVGEPYPAMARLRALWRILHFPFERNRAPSAR